MSHDSALISSLLKAATEDRVESLVELLTVQGVPVNSKGPAQQTALHKAAFAGSLAAVELLLANGAEVDATDSEGATPLCEAASKGHVNVLRLLLTNGAAVNMSVEGRSAFTVALACRQARAMSALLEFGASIPTVMPRINEEIVRYAVRKGMVEPLEVLLHGGADPGNWDEEGLTPLLHAVDRMNGAQVKCLVENGASTLQADWSGLTPLIRAVRSGSLPVVVALLAIDGSSVTVEDNDGHTALEYAVMQPNPKMVTALIQQGPSLTELAKCQNPHGVKASLGLLQTALSLHTSLLEAGWFTLRHHLYPVPFARAVETVLYLWSSRSVDSPWHPDSPFVLISLQLCFAIFEVLGEQTLREGWWPLVTASRPSRKRKVDESTIVVDEDGRIFAMLKRARLEGSGWLDSVKKEPEQRDKKVEEEEKDNEVEDRGTKRREKQADDGDMESGI